jgi:hypothetical protein
MTLADRTRSREAERHWRDARSAGPKAHAYVSLLGLQTFESAELHSTSSTRTIRPSMKSRSASPSKFRSILASYVSVRRAAGCEPSGLPSCLPGPSFRCSLNARGACLLSANHRVPAARRRLEHAGELGGMGLL